MKLLIMAAAMAVGGTAIAQEVPAPAAPQTAPDPAPMPQTAPDPAPAPETAPDPAPVPPTAEQPVTTVTTTTDSAGAPTAVAVDVASPGNYTAPPAPAPAASYPPCSRTVTDHCRQRGGI